MTASTETNAYDMDLARRVGFDCISTVRRMVLDALIVGHDIAAVKVPHRTRDYACEELAELGLLEKRDHGYRFSGQARSLHDIAMSVDDGIPRAA